MFRRKDGEELKFTASEAEKNAAHRTTDVLLVLTVSGELSRPEILPAVVMVAEADREDCGRNWPSIRHGRAATTATELLTIAFRNPAEVVVAVSDWVVLLGIFRRVAELMLAVVAVELLARVFRRPAAVLAAVVRVVAWAKLFSVKTELRPTVIETEPATRALRRPAEVLVALTASGVSAVGMFRRAAEDVVAVIARLASMLSLTSESAVLVAVTTRLGATRACLSPIAVCVAVVARVVLVTR
jgi:hypothetical protein